MKIEKGKTYVDASGTKHKIVGEWAPTRPKTFCFQDEEQNLYTAEGKYRTGDNDHQLDLVKEVE